MSKLEWSQLKQLNEAWLGCDLLPRDAIAPLTRCMQRREQIFEELRVYLDQSRDVMRDIIARFAAGELTTSQAVIEHTALMSGSAPVTTTNRTPRFSVVRDEVMAVLRKEAEAFVLSADLYSIYERVHSKHSEKQRLLARSLGNANTAEAALRAGGKVAKAWVEMQDLGERMAPLGHVYVALQRCFLIPKESPVTERVSA